MDSPAPGHVALAEPYWGAASATLLFDCRDDTQTFLRSLSGAGHAIPADWSIAMRGLLACDERWVAKAALAWSRGLVTSFEYLLWLNIVAGRSFNDLSQVRAERRRRFMYPGVATSESIVGSAQRLHGAPAHRDRPCDSMFDWTQDASRHSATNDDRCTGGWIDGWTGR